LEIYKKIKFFYYLVYEENEQLDEVNKKLRHIVDENDKKNSIQQETIKKNLDLRNSCERKIDKLEEKIKKTKEKYQYVCSVYILSF
jgi:regulator of replication initiation timing